MHKLRIPAVNNVWHKPPPHKIPPAIDIATLITTMIGSCNIILIQDILYIEAG